MQRELGGASFYVFAAIAAFVSQTLHSQSNARCNATDLTSRCQTFLATARFVPESKGKTVQQVWATS